MRGSETGDALFHERAGKISALLYFNLQNLWDPYSSKTGSYLLKIFSIKENTAGSSNLC